MPVCRQCKTEFAGKFCPSCGAEYETRRVRSHSGGGFFRFLGTLLLIVVLVLIALIVLDFLPASHDPSHATLYAIDSSVRNSIPSDALAVYDSIKAQAIELWGLFQAKYLAKP